MSATADQMEADLIAQSQGAANRGNAGDQFEADLIAQSKTKPKSAEQKSAEAQGHVRTLGGDTAGIGAGEYVYDWAKSIWNSAKTYATKKGEDMQKGGRQSNFIEDLTKAAATGAYNNTVAPLVGVATKLGGSTYDKGKQYSSINPSSNTAAAGDLLGAITKPVGEIASTPGMVSGAAAKSFDASPDTQEMASDIANIAAPVALSKLSKIGGPVKSSAESAQTVLNREASAQSMGAGGAALDLSKQSPEFVAEIQKRVDKGEKLNPKAVAAQALGDRLPIKMTFSKGQALEDAEQISNELNRRGVNPEVSVKRLNEQNQQLIDNLNAAREKYGQNDFSSNHIERGQKLIDSYLEYDKSKQADINSKYKALEDAAQGADPIDAAEIYNQTAKNLQTKLKLTRAQQLPEFNELRQLAESGSMTFDNYHTLMQDLGSVIAKGGDEAGAARIIRDSMENMPLKPGAEALRGLRNEATAAAKARFKELESDKAYSDVINGKVEPDHVIDRYITGNNKTANKTQIDAIKQKFGNDESINDAINTAVIERLRKEAGIDESGKGNFSQARYNKYLQTVSPKMKDAVSPDFIESLSDIGEAARLAKQLPAGNFVNSSNSATALMSEMAKGAEKMDIPLAGAASKVINKYADHKANQDLKQSFEYGAGISEKKRMSDLMKPQPNKDTKKK